MKPKSETHTCVLKTGKLIDFHIAENHLKGHGIPYYKQMSGSTGVVAAMPLHPNMAPDIFFEIIVPNEFSIRAQGIIMALPIDSENQPGVWHFAPTKKQKHAWKILSAIILICGSIFLVLNVLEWVQ